MRFTLPLSKDSFSNSVRSTSLSPRGFTIIELMVVVSIMAVMITVGALSYRRAALNNDALTAANIVRNTLTEAQSNAANGVNKQAQGDFGCISNANYSDPTPQPTERMEGWFVHFNVPGSTLGAMLKCPNTGFSFPRYTNIYQDTRLPRGVSFAPGTRDIGFAALNQGVYDCTNTLNIGSFAGSAQCTRITSPITVNVNNGPSGTGSAYSISVDPSGIIKVQKLY